MALFSASNPKKLRYPFETARTVALVRAAETSEAGRKYWSAEEAASVTEEIAKVSGENVKQGDFIAKRAEEALLRMRRKTPPLPMVKHGKWGEFLTAATLIVGAYVIGAFAERLISGNEPKVNILSPLLILLICWSLIFYVHAAGSLILSLIKRRHVELPARTTLAKVYGGLFAPKHITSGFRQAFMKIWEPAVLRIEQFRIARVLHWAVLAFTAGMVTSVVIRIAGTSFVIGWSIPLLNITPEQVQQLFSAVWGWLPASATFGALPDLETVREMNFGDSNAAGANAPAAIWLPRILLVIVAVVVVPRLVFILWDTVAAHFLSSRVTMNFDGYFESIIGKASAAKDSADFARRAAAPAAAPVEPPAPAAEAEDAVPASEKEEPEPPEDNKPESDEPAPKPGDEPTLLAEKKEETAASNS